MHRPGPVPPTPMLPTKIHVDADQSLLLATAPIWEDDSFGDITAVNIDFRSSHPSASAGAGAVLGSTPRPQPGLAHSNAQARVGEAGPSRCAGMLSDERSREKADDVDVFGPPPRGATGVIDAPAEGHDATFDLGDYLPEVSVAHDTRADADVDAESPMHESQPAIEPSVPSVEAWARDVQMQVDSGPSAGNMDDGSRVGDAEGTGSGTGVTQRGAAEKRAGGDTPMKRHVAKKVHRVVTTSDPAEIEAATIGKAGKGHGIPVKPASRPLPHSSIPTSRIPRVAPISKAKPDPARAPAPTAAAAAAALARPPSLIPRPNSSPVPTSNTTNAPVARPLATLPKPLSTTKADDDLYARRMRDSDRRSSLGPKPPLPIDNTQLHRSTSRSSLRESVLSRSASRSSLTASVSPSAPTASLVASSCPHRSRHATETTTAVGLGREDDDAVERTGIVAPSSQPTRLIGRGLDPSPDDASATFRAPSSLVPPHTQLDAPDAEVTTPMPGALPLRRTLSNESRASTGSRRSIREAVSDVVAGLGGLLRRSISRASMREPTNTPGVDQSCEAEETRENLGEDRSGGVALEQTAGEIELQLEDWSDEASGEVDDGDDEHQDHVLQRPAIAPLHAPASRSYPPGPRLKLPAPLTRPGVPFGSATAQRVGSARPSRAPAPPPPSGPSKPSHRPVLHPAKRVPASTTSTFAARALARLPAPGKGSTSSAKPTAIRPSDRGTDLAAKKARYEQLARAAEEERRKRMAAVLPPPPRRAVGVSADAGVSEEMTRTVPVRGHTPGKASRARAEERRGFEEALRARRTERERVEDDVRRAREEVEREEERVRRLESVVWARPAPSFGRRTEGEGE